MPVLGVAQCLAKFAEVAVLGEVATKVAVEDVKHNVAEGMRAIVPVDTGETRDSIQETEDGVVIAGAIFFLEWGTSKMAAQPVARPAADGAASEGSRIEAGMRALVQGV